MKLISLLVLFLAASLTEGGSILAIFPYQGRSHNVMFEPLMIGLARAGHEVDVVSHFPLKNPVPGFNHINLEGTVVSYVNNLTASSAQKMTSFVGSLNFIASNEPPSLCNLMRLPQLQEILNTTKHYDVMITEVFGTNCYLAVAHKLKLPVIGVLTSAMYPWAYDAIFDSDNPSYIPTQFTRFSSQMSFFERLENTIIHVGSKLLFFYYEKTVSEPLARQYVPDMPSLTDLYFNMSLMLVNTHRSIIGSRPTSPAMIPVAGVHIDETQKLNKELEAYLDSATGGVIYFSMGSMVKSESFSVEKIQAIYQSFAELSNYKVLWKGKVEEMPKGIPSNVKMTSWIPQFATLRHPNVKAFVTHGGLMGTMEAIHAGVPMIGIPFFADQRSNVAGYALQGIAVHLDYADLTKATFSNAVREVLTNPKYKSSIDTVSRLFKDRPLSPMQEAIYWVEFVMRNGGESLKSAALHLHWFQYYLLDVCLFLLIAAVLVLTVLYLAVKKLFGLLASKAYFTQTKVKTG